MKITRRMKYLVILNTIFIVSALFITFYLTRKDVDIDLLEVESDKEESSINIESLSSTYDEMEHPISEIYKNVSLYLSHFHKITTIAGNIWMRDFPDYGDEVLAPYESHITDKIRNFFLGEWRFNMLPPIYNYFYRKANYKVLNLPSIIQKISHFDSNLGTYIANNQQSLKKVLDKLEDSIREPIHKIIQKFWVVSKTNNKVYNIEIVGLMNDRLKYLFHGCDCVNRVMTSYKNGDISKHLGDIRSLIDRIEFNNLKNSDEEAELSKLAQKLSLVDKDLREVIKSGLIPIIKNIGFVKGYKNLEELMFMIEDLFVPLRPKCSKIDVNSLKDPLMKFFNKVSGVSENQIIESRNVTLSIIHLLNNDLDSKFFKFVKHFNIMVKIVNNLLENFIVTTSNWTAGVYMYPDEMGKLYSDTLALISARRKKLRAA